VGDIELTSAELDELERLAKAATPGPWFQTGAPWFRDGSGVLAGSPDGNVAYLIADTDDFGLPRDEYEGFPLGDKEDDAAYIASANPATILRLLSLARAGIEAGKAEGSMRERAAAKLDQRVTEIATEYGDYEPDTNYTNLPEWAEAEDGLVRALGGSNAE